MTWYSLRRHRDAACRRPTTRSMAGRCAPPLVALAARDGRDRARRRDPRRLARGLRGEGRPERLLRRRSHRRDRGERRRARRRGRRGAIAGRSRSPPRSHSPPPRRSRCSSFPAVVLLSWLIEPARPSASALSRSARSRAPSLFTAARALRRPVEPEARSAPPLSDTGSSSSRSSSRETLETRSDVVKKRSGSARRTAYERV